MASSSASTLRVNEVNRSTVLKEKIIDSSLDSTAPKGLLLFPVPRHLRYDPNHPPKFGIWMNCGLSLAATFLISNMYYCQPLLTDLAHPKQRAFAYSIVLVGMLSGVLVARVFAGLVAEFTTWRVVYYMAIGIQYAILILCYLIIPDYPAKNLKLSYGGILWTMIKYAVTEPLMIQIEAMAFLTSACFSSYWVTLTFLLGGDPYNYSTLIIGLFGLLGLAGMALGPFAGRIIDRIAPWYSVFLSTVGLLVFQAVQTAAGGINVGAVIVACVGLDALRQVQNVGIMTCLFGIEMGAVSRLNALFVLFYYLGQLMGTSLGTKIFVDLGWRACSAVAMGWYALQLVVLLLRGPHCKRETWFGYEGGWGWKRKDSDDSDEGVKTVASNDLSPTASVQGLQLRLSEKVETA
ncbi:hypothetical protein CVT24_004218 [Panaeolus cyanescens]|uniref:Major facilitator superfamily (MFS) profile domain-containing protein n=1 Tax=Panaeolus cyanescens TaxID=181874 RepID=A0A409YT00_9AGAR|nr:hypothetical protein CVT24_004218 [Panaeolus cyanescens]